MRSRHLPSKFNLPMQIPVLIHKETDGYSAEFPTLPGCFTEGDTREELMHNICEVLEGWLTEWR